MKGEPTQLSWSPDGTSFFLQTSEWDRLGMIKSPRYFTVPATGGKPESLKAAPDWAPSTGHGRPQVGPRGLVPDRHRRGAEDGVGHVIAMGGALARGGGTDPTAGTTMDDAVVHAQQTQKHASSPCG
jgi:hypothetical protein